MCIRDRARTVGGGAALLALGVGAVSLGIVKGPDWHWDGRVVAAVVTGLVVLAAFAVRSARHPSPALELSLFRVRSFAVANVGVFVFSLGFYALLLGNVLFLTGVWHYSVLEAGFALTPGPLMAALAAPLGLSLIHI